MRQIFGLNSSKNLRSPSTFGLNFTPQNSSEGGYNQSDLIKQSVKAPFSILEIKKCV